ncbi:MAG: hypothetical protein AUJ92_19285 [Armatimonadetes bacterium CG2_30_59_28]|nr:cytochrome c3 family protein [Armatimonadota bacterium]OIO90219.1 MAG: hypothetical protein AUJ92_19285 [Armatimonadetes bacterium CG2_30_59_28]
MRTTAKYLIIGAVLTVGIQQLSAHVFAPRPVRQPFEFNHAKHIKKDWTCLACHPGADAQSVAGVPSVQECAECHKSEGVDKPATRKVAALAASDKEIPWVKIHRLPDYIYFSHRRHVTLAKLDCKECHGDMKSRTTPVDRQVLPISMKRCVECHKMKHASTDCLACHK